MKGNRRTRLGWGVAALLFLSSLVYAAPTPYRVQGRVVYQAKSPIGTFKGKNEAVQGEILWDPETGTLSGKVCLDLSRWESGEPLRDKHTRAMFEVDRYPEACYVITGIEGDPAQGPVTLLGELTLHGVTRPLAIPGTVRFEGETILFEGQFETKITDWKMKRPSLMGIKVRDPVRVWVYGEAIPK